MRDFSSENGQSKMCRYAWHNYRDHFACFGCRKAFKYWQGKPCDENTFREQQKLKQIPRNIVCPDCKKSMTDMGLDFKAPPKAKVEAWKILEILAQNGVTFHSCGCSVGFVPPRTLREVPQWLNEHRSKFNGETALDTIEKKGAAKVRKRKINPVNG